MAPAPGARSGLRPGGLFRRLRGLGLGAALLAAAARPAAANFDWAGHVELDAEGLSSDDAGKRLEAVGELGKYDISLTQGYLLSALTDKDEKVRQAAAKSLGLGAVTRAVPTMVEWLTDPDVKAKQVAADVLGDIGDPDATSALTRSLGDTDPGVRTHAVRALGKIGKHGNPAVVISLIPRLEDDKADVRIATIAQLEELGDRKAVIPLVARFGDTAPEARRSAVHAIGRLGDARATAALAAELERGRVATPAVLKALGATGDPQALVPVLGALASKDAAIRLAAMEALRPLLGSDARAGDVLIEHLADDDLEIRVLAAEYLGVLGVGSSAARLTALTATGNPMRLRHAAIDALGEIGRAHHLPAGTTATGALLDVLREGPGELHAAAATALSYIASPAALPPLLVLARADRGPTRCEVVRAIGATLRGQPDPAARQLLRTLVDDVSARVGLAAIAGLAAAQSRDDAPLLRNLLDQGAADRRRAAAWALGEIHDRDAIDVLSSALASKDDRLAGDAAWALGEILAGGKPVPDPRAGAVADRWIHAVQRGGWAAAINSAAGLARLLWALPKAERAELLTGPRREALLARSFHKSRLVRINLALAFAAVGDDAAVKQLAQLLKDDASPHVRIAAARALHRIGGSHAAAALKAAADTDPDPNIRAAAKTAPGAIPPRGEWRTFYVVDPSAGDTRVRQEPYFVHSPDDVVWASYTDARGELTTEHIPAETTRDSIAPASHEPEY